MLIRAAGLALGPGLCWSLVASGQFLCTFEMPESVIQFADMSFAYRYFDDGRTPGVELNGGWIAARLDSLYDSPDLGSTMWVDTRLDLKDGAAASWITSGSASYRYYFAQDLPLFAYAGVRVDASTAFAQPGAEIRSGLGLGRFRDVTPLAKAYRIVYALYREGAMARPLRSESMIRVAEEISRIDEYESFEVYAASIAELLASLAQREFGSSAILTIREELEDDSSNRFCGAILQGGVGYELVDPYREAEDVVFVLSGDVGRALTADSQIRLRLSWSGASDNFLGENTSLLELTYDAETPGSDEVKAGYSIQRLSGNESAPTTSQRATIEYALDVGRADLSIGLDFSRESIDLDWTIDFTVSVVLDLL